MSSFVAIISPFIYILKQVFNILLWSFLYHPLSMMLTYKQYA